MESKSTAPWPNVVTSVFMMEDLIAVRFSTLKSSPTSRDGYRNPGIQCIRTPRSRDEMHIAEASTPKTICNGRIVRGISFYLSFVFLFTTYLPTSCIISLSPSILLQVILATSFVIPLPNFPILLPRSPTSAAASSAPLAILKGPQIHVVSTNDRLDTSFVMDVVIPAK